MATVSPPGTTNASAGAATASQRRVVHGGDAALPDPQLVADAMYQRDNQFSLASAYGQALAIGLTTDDVDTWPDRIKAVTSNAVRNAVAKDLPARESVTGYLQPGKPR